MAKKQPPQQRTSIVDIITGFSGQDANIVIPRTFLKWCNNDLSVALFLSQCLYWSSHTDDPDGWFARTVAQWESDTTLTRSPLERAAVILEQVGLKRDVKRSRWHEFTPVVHYRFDRPQLEAAAQEFFATGVALNMESTRDAKAKLRAEREKSKLETRSKRNSEVIPEHVPEMRPEIISEVIPEGTSYKENTKEEQKEKENIAPDGAVSSSPLKASAQDDMGHSAISQGAAWDVPRPVLYACTDDNIVALITAWLYWAPVLPTRHGKVMPSSAHYGNKTNREYARVLYERGYRPNDFIAWWQEQRANAMQTKKAIGPMNFVYVAERVERWAPMHRAQTIYTLDCPRCYAWKPDAQNGNAEAEALILWSEGLHEEAEALGYSIDIPPRLFTAAEYDLLKAGKPLPMDLDDDYEEAI